MDYRHGLSKRHAVCQWCIPMVFGDEKKTTNTTYEEEYERLKVVSILECRELKG